MHKPQADGQWQLEVSPCVQVLARNKPAILKALADAKYDKITHVRQAAGKALVEMDCIPSPRGIPSLAEALQGTLSSPRGVLRPCRMYIPSFQGVPSMAQALQGMYPRALGHPKPSSGPARRSIPGPWGTPSLAQAQGM